MKRFFYAAIALLIGSLSQAQDTTYSKEFALGETKVQLLSTCFVPCNGKVLFLNVHENENTSVKAAMEFIPALGGSMFRLQHSGDRNISFKLDNKKYVVDPNRIYTSVGLKASLEKNSTYSKEAADVVQVLANQILQVVTNYKLVIALHNNTNKNFSILDYKKGGSEAMNTASLYINPEMDEDDFILTTERSIYHHLKARKINVILQDNKRAIDDGSLSVYAGKKKLAYINIEAQEGHRAEQLRLLNAVQEIIAKYQK
jgi:hypothetical protein